LPALLAPFCASDHTEEVPSSLGRGFVGGLWPT
jgi:hypothetical protein